MNAVPSLPGPGESRGEPSRLFAHGAAGTASDVPSGLFDKWGEAPYSPLSSISEEDSSALTERNPLLNGSHDEFISGSPSALLPSNEERAEGEGVSSFTVKNSYPHAWRS